MITSPTRRRLLLACCLLPIAMAAACGGTDASSTGDSGASTAATDSSEPTEAPDNAVAADGGAEATTSSAAFPVVIEHALGSTEIPAMPSRVVSASATMTGHLLAIDAPVVAAQVLPPASPLADDQGFLVQWGGVAAERGVEPIAGPEVDIEAIAAARPDLIVGNSFGGDAITDDVYALLSAVAPTIVIDHSAMTWQELAVILGQATGHSDDATAVIEQFDGDVAAAAERLDTSVPVVAAVVSAEGINAFTPDSSHGRLLTALGFEVIDIEGTNQINEAGQGSRADVVSVSPENVVDLFGEATLLYIFAEPDQLPELVDVHPTLGLLPSTTEQRSVALGIDSFRLDRYSAANVVDRLVAAQS